MREKTAYRNRRRPRDAARAFGAAARLAETPAQRADILSRQAVMLVQAGRFDRARAVAERALELAIAEGALAVQARAKEAMAPEGARLVDVYVTMGHCDLVAIVEAPDAEAMMRVSARIAAQGNFRADTMSATPVGQFIERLREGSS